MKLAILYSGGKDSHLALNIYFKHIVGLITIKPLDKHPYMYHNVNIDLVKIHSNIMNIPLLYWEQKDKELSALYQALDYAIKIWNIDGIVSGVIASNYQYSRIKNICDKLDLELYVPLWGIDIDNYFDLYDKYLIKSILVGIYAYPLNQEYLFKEYNKRLALELESLNINPFGEGGEFESFVYTSKILPKIDYKIISIEGKHNSWTGHIKV